MQADADLLLCQRHIKLNPVRAGMVPDPARYRWSSYRANALGEPDTLLSPHPFYLALGADDEARNAADRHLFRNTLDQQPLADRQRPVLSRDCNHDWAAPGVTQTRSAE